VDYGSQENRSNIFIVGFGVQGNLSIRFVDSTEVKLVINTNVERTNCLPHIICITELAVRMYITLDVWHVPLRLRVYRPLAVLLVIV